VSEFTVEEIRQQYRALVRPLIAYSSFSWLVVLAMLAYVQVSHFAAFAAVIVIGVIAIDTWMYVYFTRQRDDRIAARREYDAQHGGATVYPDVGV